MKKQVVDLSNKNISEIDIPESIFGIKVFPDLIHQYIRYQNAKSRQGSHKTKTRSEIKGKAKKPFAQKGTGNARQGSSNLLIIGAVLLQWVLKIEIILFHLIKKKKL